MIDADGTLLAWAIEIAFALLMLALGLAVLRLALGPSQADRVVALDLVTILAVAFSALFSIASDEPAFLDVAIALALVAFLATVAFARFVERRRLHDDHRNPEGRRPRPNPEVGP